MEPCGFGSCLSKLRFNHKHANRRRTRRCTRRRPHYGFSCHSVSPAAAAGELLRSAARFNEMAEHFRLSLTTVTPSAPLIALLRRHTGKPLSHLREAIVTRQPFLDETPHHNEYSDFIVRITKMLDDLEVAGIAFQVEVDGVPQSPQYLRNVFQQWHDIGVQTEYMDDLESGDPCIETLEWLKSTSPPDVFFHTLNQIIQQDGYNVDAETLAWAQRQIESAGPGTADRGG